MQFSRKNLTNFDLYPFAAIACDSDGFVIYKNELTRKLYKNIHIGARLSTYTDAALMPSRIAITNFYGEKSTVFICDIEDDDGLYIVITVFPVGFSSADLYTNCTKELENAVKILLNNDDNGSSSEKRSLLRDIVKKHELAKTCGMFASSYIENQNLFSSDIASASDFISRVVNVINNRLGLDVKLELIDTSECSPYIKINKSTAFILLNFISFSILNSDKDIKITVSSNNSFVNVSLKYYSKHILENIFSDNIVAYYTFVLLTGIDTAEQNNINVSFSNQDNIHTINTAFPLMITNDMTFRSNNLIDEIIEEYIELSQTFFKV